MDGGAELLEDAGSPVRAAARWAQHRRTLGGVAGPLLLSDTVLARVGRDAVVAGLVVPVVVQVSGGAGGVLAAAGRSVPGVAPIAVLSTLRDLDDLAGNARRVVTAAAALPEDVPVVVGLPAAGRWEAAVEVIEEAGLTVAVAAGPGLAAQLHLLVEADVGFRVLATDGRPPVVAVLAATAALIETGDVGAAERLLHGKEDPYDAFGSPDPSMVSRIRRRLVAIAVPDVAEAAAAMATGTAGTVGTSRDDPSRSDQSRSDWSRSDWSRSVAPGGTEDDPLEPG